MEHTKEPWKVNGDEVGYISDNDDQSFGMFCPVGVIYEPANARRIVACVNACAGIPTEKLDGIAHAIGERAAELIAMAEQRDELQLERDNYKSVAEAHSGAFQECIRLREQRDELLAAIKNLRLAASERDKRNRIRLFDQFMDDADAAIAKVKK